MPTPEQVAAAEELRRATGLYREVPDEAWGLLRGTYMEAVDTGLSTGRIENITGLSISELNEIVGEP